MRHRPRVWLLLVAPLIFVAVVATYLVGGLSSSGPAQAVDAGPGMTLSVTTAAQDCDNANKPTKCTFDPGEPFVLTVNANPAPSVAIAGFASEVFFPVAPEAGGCDNKADDDGDLAVNDGCPQVGAVSESQCGNDKDDDGDTKVNDGCPAVGAAETGADCANSSDDDNDGAVNDGCPADGDPEQAAVKAPTCINTVDDDGDTVVNDGCPQVGDTAEPELDFCTNVIDDDGDGVINDGCPTVGGLAETGAQCTNNTDDDPSPPFNILDGVVNDGCPVVGSEGEDPCGNATDDDNDGFINDGCAPVGFTEATGCDGSADDDRDGTPNDGCPQQGGTAEAGSLCADSTDDDNDGFINDGCGTAGSAPESGAQCANATDDDNDGRTNDGCPPAGAELPWSQGACGAEVQVTVGGNPPPVCLSGVTSVGAAGHSVVSALEQPPLPALDVTPGGAAVLLALDFTCAVQGSHLVALLASPDSGNGAVYTDTVVNLITVKTVEQQLDLDFDGTPESHQVADTLVINCGAPPTPSPTPVGPSPTPTVTPTPTATPTTTPSPTPTATPTPLSGAGQINITKVSAPFLLRGACFQVFLFLGTSSFQVCDNNLQELDIHPACEADGTPQCEDSDPATGIMRVVVVPGFYDVFETKSPVNFTADPVLRICDPRPGSKCEVTFENVFTANPTFPWDIDGDGLVGFFDFLQLLQHYNEIETAEGPTPTPPAEPPSDSGQLNITKVSAPVLLGGACFEVFLFPGPGSFQVCDNNLQEVDLHLACLADGTPQCEDSDPTPGLMRVTVDPGFYDVVETKSPVNFTDDPALRICDPHPGSKCEVTFENVFIANPSFPWDLDGDGLVGFFDFLQLLQHYNQTKP